MDTRTHLKTKADRFNEGKLRYDLIDPIATKGLVQVLTKGAEKYAPNNWKRGLSWTSILASSKRHLAAIEAGEDYDPETGELHVDHIQCNFHFLSHHYYERPEFDDRNPRIIHRIGLDIDEVLCGWVNGYKKFYNYPEEHEFKSWYLHYDILKHCTDDLNCEWYLGLQPLIKPEDIPFEPYCYITARNIPKEVTMEWLHTHGYPTRPVHVVGLTDSKVEIAKREGIEIFVDDVYKNFCELNEAGVFCYLMDRPHNRRFQVGHKRIYNLKNLS